MSDVIDQIARIIDPVWFGEADGRHLLDNYPDQHLKYQAAAKEKASKIYDLVEQHLMNMHDPLRD